MGQITTGVRRVLSLPAVYDAFQDSLGANASRATLCRQYIRANAGDTMVDVGCGTAVILDHLPAGIRYYGFDLSPAYIAAAEARYGNRGTFACRDITQLEDGEIPWCQIALSIGVLHHLDDAGAEALLKSVHSRLAPGGRLVTLDPAYWPEQSAAAKFLISRDRGQHVRHGDEYRKLAERVFAHVSASRRDDLLRVPYSHAVLECTK